MVNVDVRVVVIYHYDSPVGGVQLNRDVLHLVASLRPLMRWLRVFLWLNNYLVTQVSPMINAVDDGHITFYLFLVQADHGVGWALFCVLRCNFATFNQWTHIISLNQSIGFGFKSPCFVLVFVSNSILGFLGMPLVESHFLRLLFKRFLYKLWLPDNSPITHSIFLVSIWVFLAICSADGFYI